MLRITFLLIIMLVGCTTTSIKQAGIIALTANSHYTLAKTPPNMIGHGFLSLVKGRHDNNDYELLVQVELNQHDIVMVGTTVNGIELFELVWYDNKPYQLKQSTLAKSIDVEYLLADFQLVHWPLESLNQHLKGLTVSQNDQGRVINQGNQPIITITNNPDSGSDFDFKNHYRDYQLTIKMLEKWTN